MQLACITSMEIVHLQQYADNSKSWQCRCREGSCGDRGCDSRQLLAVCNPLAYACIQPSDYADHPQLKEMSQVCTHAICQLVLVCVRTSLLRVSIHSVLPCNPTHFTACVPALSHLQAVNVPIPNFAVSAVSCICNKHSADWTQALA